MVAVTLIKGDKMETGKVDYRDALPVNMFGVPRDTLGSNGYMYQIYGLGLFANGAGVDRGGIWVFAKGLEGHYRVSGTSLISINMFGVVTTLGTISGEDQCSITYSYNNVIIVGNKQLFYYNPTAGFREITSGGIVGNPIDCIWLQNYVFLTDGTSTYHSNVLDEEVFSVADSAQPEFNPDQVLAIEKNKTNELVIFCSNSVQHQYNIGSDSGYAFASLLSKNSLLGILGTHCKAELKNIYYTLARFEEGAPSCFIYSQSTPQKIASREIEKVLARYTPDELSTTTIDAFTRDAVDLVIYHFPNDTYMFNATIAPILGLDSAWTRLKSDVEGDAPYRGKNIVLDERNGKWLVGDRRNSNIGELSDTLATHYGDIAEWLLFTPFLKLETLSIDQLEIETIPGIVDSAKDATVFVSTNTNGRTYGKEWTQLYGDQWDYSQRFYIRRFGYVRDWIGFKFRGASRSRMAFGLLDIEAS